MKGNHFTPSERLSPFVKTYLIIESSEEAVNRVLPDTSLVMAFRFKGQVSYRSNGTNENLPSSVASGLRKSARLINYSKDAANILVIFKLAGADAFFKEPIYELFEESVSLDNFAGYQNIAMIEEQLMAATSNAQRINLIERFLSSKLISRKPDKLMLTAVERITQTSGILKIRDLADTLCISMDPFEKRFRRTVGVSPKQFSYIVRLKSIIGGGLKKETLAEDAFHAGYFDQAHFNKDFKLFTGQTPTDFLKAPVFW
jgi:AraC-like DNA-binding protein